jgi:HEPN domain-containing protein
MERIIIALFLAITLAFTGAGVVYAEKKTDHLSQASEHVNAAISQGQTGNANALAQHAQTALEHVKMAQQEKPSPDLDRAVKSLEETIQQSKSGSTDKAVEHAKEAVEYIDAAKAALGG